MVKHLLSIKDLSKKEILELIKFAKKIKNNPKKYHKSVYEKVLFTFFEAPSLRTELSFDTAMFQMGGEVIDYHAETSPWKKGKETIEDVGRVISRYCDIVMARIYDHNELKRLAYSSKIPVINGMTNFEHPCQILGDLLTILENKKRLTNLKLSYFGDSFNNVTHSLLYATSMLGIDISIACPNNKEFMPDEDVLREAKKFAKKLKAKIEITSDPFKAIKNSDIVYTDSWMSYRIDKSELPKRSKILKPYQVNELLFSHAKKDAVFMHCLPAIRGQEVTTEVIDGPRSIVLDQAENRLHIQKAIILKLLRK